MEEKKKFFRRDPENAVKKMGCAISSSDAESKSKAIDKSLAAEGMQRNNEIKLLLLG